VGHRFRRLSLTLASASGVLAAALYLLGVLPPSMAATTASTSKGEALVRQSDCLSCHAVDRAIIGPSFVTIADRFAGKPNIVPFLVDKVKKGGADSWWKNGSVAMSPHPDLSGAQITAMVDWILSLKGKHVSESARASKSSEKIYAYTTPSGKKVTVDFPVFASDRKVTGSVFTGYELFDSYCFRCHGTDAEGGVYAPDLRNSLNNGMTRDQFIAIALAGRPAKGMPSWAGFFSRDQLESIYEYVKGRSTGLIPPGTPEQAGGQQLRARRYALLQER